MKWLFYISSLFLLVFVSSNSYSQTKKTRIKKQTSVSRPDSVSIPKSQVQLFLPPKRNLLVTHVDVTTGAGRVMKDDNKSEIGFAAAVKGLYAVTGVLYVNMGIGISRLASRQKAEAPFISQKHSLTAVTLPLGIGFSIGDDRAQIVNGIDFFPVYYVDAPDVKRLRQFAYGFGIDLGFHIRIRERLHLGMMGKLQLFQPFDKDEHQSFPRYGFVGGGVLLRYD